MPAVHVAGLWRYPVKSLAGEALPVAELTHDGLAGDRLVHVRDGTGPLTGRTRSGLLTQPATTGTDGVPLVDGHRWDTATALALVRERAGAGASLAAYDGPERFDITNLLVATDGAVAHLGHDVRRLRPNLLVGGVGPAEEATWRGRALDRQRTGRNRLRTPALHRHQHRPRQTGLNVSLCLVLVGAR